MNYRITGLDSALFIPLFGLSSEALRTQNAVRCVVDTAPGYPDRIELRDAAVGETVLLVNFTHQTAQTPYRASHAIFVREGATDPFDRIGMIPHSLRIRLVSLRAFSADGMMLDADLAQGNDLELLIERFLSNPQVAYLHAHNAKHGCYAARIDRA